MQASGARSKREAVELGLRTLVRLQQQGEIRSFRGRLPLSLTPTAAGEVQSVCWLAKTAGAAATLASTPSPAGTTAQTLF